MNSSDSVNYQAGNFDKALFSIIFNIAVYCFVQSQGLVGERPGGNEAERLPEIRCCLLEKIPNSRFSMLVEGKTKDRMKNKKIVWIALLLFFLFPLIIGFSKLEAHPFKVGEKLTYKVKLWGIPVGEQVLEIKGIVPMNEGPTYHLYSKVNTSGWADFLLSRSYSVESLVDIDTLYPYEVRNYAREGNSPPKEIIAKIDQEKGVVLFEDRGIKRKWERELSALAIDTISLIYWLRSKSLQVGDEFSFSLLEDSSLRTIKIKVVKKEKIEGSLAFLCSEVDSDKIKVWLSVDERHLPLRIKVDLGGALPSLSSYLISIE